MPNDNDETNSLPKTKSTTERLAEQLLRDRAKHAERPTEQRERTPGWREGIGFDPYQVTNWKVIAGPDPGYMPKTAMRQGAVGFYIHCKACNGAFESKGLAYCQSCMELPAEERHAMKPAFTGRMCQAPGCENQISRSARAGAKYCSGACQQRASRERRNV